MKKIEKAMQMAQEGLRERIKRDCPHNYGMKDRVANARDFMCDLHCEECWNEEVEDDGD